MACSTLAPASIALRICGPSDGRVIFWLETAPTPGSSHGQRDPTAMLDELMAMPN